MPCRVLILALLLRKAHLDILFCFTTFFITDISYLAYFVPDYSSEFCHLVVIHVFHCFPFSIYSFLKHCFRFLTYFNLGLQLKREMLKKPHPSDVIFWFSVDNFSRKDQIKLDC